MGNTASLPIKAIEDEAGNSKGLATSLPVYAIEDVPGKGKGLVATKDIPKGTRIISEEPVFSVGQTVADIERHEIRIYQQVSSLSEDQVKEFLTMGNVYPYTNAVERYRGIFLTNALPMGSDLNTGGIFFNACRINHSCDNNAQNFWNENLNQLTIHAVQPIQKGEEITIFYLRSQRNRQARQEELQTNFKFTCHCKLCSLSQAQRIDSDAKLDRIHAIDWIIEQGGVQGLISPARRLLSYIDEQVQLWSHPTPNDIGLARAYPDAFQIAIANGDLARARVFAERLVPIYVTTIGADSPDVMEYSELALDPTTHEYYGLSMQWKTAVDEVPQGLGPKKFEDWLWKR